MPILLVVRWTKSNAKRRRLFAQQYGPKRALLASHCGRKVQIKQVVDTIFVRAGDVLAAGLVFVGSELLQMSISVFALVNVVVIALWLLVAVRLGLSTSGRTLRPRALLDRTRLDLALPDVTTSERQHGYGNLTQ